MAASGACRGCGSSDRGSFFSIESVPVGSCVLLDTYQAATAYPSASIDLAVCHSCGLIQNAAFDESLVDYTSGYEESQAYSPTFLAYADALIEHLDARYRLNGSTIIEPGCGKGEFLAMMCEQVGARGIGIDPAHVADRLETTADVEFELAMFTVDTKHTGELVLCRHTLEHIEDVAGFLDAMRSCAERTEGAGIVVEVPDTQRVLDEGAFWDVYYEHASYFTDVSLRIAAQRAGIVTDHIGLWYEDQYLVFEGSVADASDQRDEQEVRRVVTAAEMFAGRVSAAIDDWGDRLGAAERPVLWGASSKAVGFLAAVAVPHLAGTVDINPFKQGSFLAGSGAEIFAPEQLPELSPDLVVVMNPIYTGEITATIAEMGVRCDIVAC